MPPPLVWFSHQLDKNTHLQREAFFAAYEQRPMRAASPDHNILKVFGVAVVLIASEYTVTRVLHLPLQAQAAFVASVTVIGAAAMVAARKAAHLLSRHTQRMATAQDPYGILQQINDRRLDTLADAWLLGRAYRSNPNNQPARRAIERILEDKGIVHPADIGKIRFSRPGQTPYRFLSRGPHLRWD